MASINRFNQAQPAQDNYFNTFVPLPLEQLTALGMSRQKDLEKNQDLINKTYDQALSIQAMPGADETTVKTKILPAISDLATKYSSVDLSNPQEMQNFRRELRQKVDPELINRIEQSHAGYVRYMNMVDKLSQEGKYSRQLDSADPSGWDSAHRGVFSSSPEAYEGKASLFEPYFNNLRPKDYIDAQHGMIRSEIRPEDIDRLSSANAADLVNTPKGQQELKLFKMNYPDVAKHLGSDEAVMRHLMNDFGQDRVGSTMTALPVGWDKAYGSGSQNTKPTSFRSPERVSTAGNIHSWDNITDVKSEINDLKKQGNTQGALDLQYALEDAAKENKLDLSKYLDTKPLLGDPKFIQKAEDLIYGSPKDTDAVKKTLQQISYTVSNKLSFGFPHYDSGSLSQSVDPTTGKKLGTFDFEDLSNNMIAHPDLHEILDVNGKPLKGKELKGAITKDLIDVSVGVTPKSQNEYKPEITFTYQDSKTGKTTSVRSLINDPTSQRNTATILYNRGDYTAATAIMQPHLANAVETTNFEVNKPVTFKLVVLDKNGNKTDQESPLKITRDSNNRSTFHIEYDTAKEGHISDIANGRQELTAKMYDLVSKNNVEFEK
jgi:hypothetical protein